MNEEIFWLDKFEGEARGGLFVRNPLFEFLERCEKEGIKVVGIKKPDDWNLELIFIKKEKKHELENNAVN